MLGYLTSSLITASLWGFIIIIDVLMGKISALASLCIGGLCKGLASLLIFFFLSDTLNKDFNHLWKKKRNLLFIFILSIFFLGTAASYFFYNAFNKAGDKCHIAFSIMLALPIVISGLGAYFFLEEKMNFASFFGMFLVVVGIIIMKIYGPKN